MLSDQVIGALLVLLGVLVSQLVEMVKSRWDRQNKREILLRTKYEELGTHFLESMKLPHTLMACRNDEEILALTYQASGNHAHLLALLYFQELRPATGQYIESYSSLCLVAASLYSERDERPVGMQVFNNAQYIEARNSHISARDHLQDQIQDHASKYAKS